MSAPRLSVLLTTHAPHAHRVLLTGGVVARRVRDGGWRLTSGDERAAEGGPPGADDPGALLGALGLHAAAGEPEGPAAPPGADPAQPAAPGERAAQRAAGREAAAARAAAALAALDALAAAFALRPVVLSGGAPHAPGTALVSARGALGWQPPLDALADTPGMAAHARRLRWLVAAAEHHALAAAERYAEGSALAATIAGALARSGARPGSAVVVPAAVCIEVEALMEVALRTFDATARLVADVFTPARAGGAPGRGGGAAAVPHAGTAYETRVLGARLAPVELREALLDAWARGRAEGAPAWRRALRRAGAADAGATTLRAEWHDALGWRVSLPIAVGGPLAGAPLARAPLAARPAHGEAGGAPAGHGGRGPGRLDAFELAWELATEGWRAAALAIHAIVGHD